MRVSKGRWELSREEEVEEGKGGSWTSHVGTGQCRLIRLFDQHISFVLHSPWQRRRDNYKSQFRELASTVKGGIVFTITLDPWDYKSQFREFALTVKGVTIFTITDDPRIKPSSLGSAEL